MTRLTFTPGNHSYWLADPDTGKKRRIPSVSSLKKTLHAFDGERYFLGIAADTASDEWDHVAGLAPTSRRSKLLTLAQERAARPREFGTAVHHYCEHLWGGEPVEVPEDYAGHVTAVAEWWAAEQVTLVAAEGLCWSDADPDMGLGPAAGRFDLLVSHPTRGLGLVDLKTWTAGSAGQPRPDEWAFQLAGYAAMDWLVDDTETDVPFPRVGWCSVLHVGPPGLVEYLLPDADRARAVDQVECARALKALPKPRMEERKTA